MDRSWFVLCLWVGFWQCSISVHKSCHNTTLPIFPGEIAIYVAVATCIAVKLQVVYADHDITYAHHFCVHYITINLLGPLPVEGIHSTIVYHGSS